MAVGIEEMQLLPVGGKAHFLAAVDIGNAGDLDDDRLAINQTFDIELRHFTERLDDGDLAFEEIIFVGRDAQIFRTNAEARLLTPLGSLVGKSSVTDLPPFSVTVVVVPVSVTVAGMMFIAGEPMNLATKRLAGRS